jgi:hypothetical protein
MKRSFIAVICMVSFAFLSAVPSALAQADKLVGVWRIAEAETLGKNPQKIKNPRPGILIFTRNHFSWVDVHGNPAPDLPEPPTLAYFAAAFDQLTAYSGSYEVKGSSIIANVIVSKNPNALKDNSTLNFEFKFEGDMLVLTLRQLDLELKMRRLE